MGRLAFIPFSIAAGLLAGLAAKKTFEALWGAIDDQEPPDSEHRDVSWQKLAVAGALQGAAFGSTRALADHASRVAFARATGSWPGEERPDAT